MPGPEKLVAVFADLNCPFCYALAETLERNQVQHLTYWKLVEHAPLRTTPWRPAGPVLRQTLESEVDMVRKRVPDLTLQVPEGQPNTRLPSLAVAMLSRESPALALQLKQRFQRALFVSNMDVGDPKVVASICAELGVPAPDVTPELEQSFDAWGKQWAAMPRRIIPTMVAPDGTARYGLGDPEEAVAFVKLHGGKA